MLHLEGTKEFPLSRPELWAKLTDLRFLTKCIPDVSEVKEVSEKTASLVLRPGFSFVRGHMDLHIDKKEETPPEMALLALKTRGIGTSSEVEAAFHMEEQGSGTLLRWSVDIKHLGGLMKAVPSGLIQAGAQKVIGDLMTSIEAKIGADT